MIPLRELTGPQTVAMQSGYDVVDNSEAAQILPPFPSGVTYDTYRALRQDPTLALARAVIYGVASSCSWSIDASDDVDDDIIRRVQATVMRVWSCVLQHGILDGIDYGYAGFEIVYIAKDGYIEIDFVKPLLPDITYVLVSDSGRFWGYRQRTRMGTHIDVPGSKCLHIPFDMEGTQWYGTPLLEAARRIVQRWEDADRGARTYDRKIAGSHFVVHYPPGTSRINGRDVDNGVVASELLRALEASGSIAIPRTIVEYVEQLNAAAAELMAWKIELLSDGGGRQPSFIDRLRYLDSCKIRCLGLPERAVLEGEFGTRAEAAVHADMSWRMCQTRVERIVDCLNRQLVDTYVHVNFGAKWKGKINIVVSPIVDERLGYLRSIYSAILANPQGFIDEFPAIDTDMLKDILGVPKSREVAPSASQASELPMPGMEDGALNVVAQSLRLPESE